MILCAIMQHNYSIKKSIVSNYGANYAFLFFENRSTGLELFPHCRHTNLNKKR